MASLKVDGAGDLVEVKVFTNIPKSNEDVTFYALTTREAVEATSEEQVQKEIQEQLKEVQFDKAAVIKGVDVSFDYEVSGHPFFQPIGETNLLIEVNLPYCLHLPDKYLYEVKLGEQENAYLRLRKVWTEKTTNPTRPEDLDPSSSNDLFAEDREVFFGKAQILTPVFPQKENVGWHYLFRGQNVEMVADTTGYFRYTKVFIYIKASYTKEEIAKNSATIKSLAESKALEIVNNLIEVYRYVAEEEYVERLAQVNIMNIYFFDLKQAIITASLATHHIRNASINKPRTVIEKVRSMLSSGAHPMLYETLLLNAKNSLRRGDFSSSVVAVFQSFEIFLENFLINSYKSLGLNDDQIKQKMDLDWETKKRLRQSLKEITNKDLLIENKALWESWCNVYDQIRNEVIHKGLFPTKSMAEKAMSINEDAIKWVSSLTIDKVAFAKIKKPNNQRKVFSIRCLKFNLKLFKDL